VLPASKSGIEQLWLYDLTPAESQPLAGTESAVLPFWSTEGRAIGFFASGELRVLALDDGTVRSLAPAPSPRGGVWHPSGDIIFAADAAQGLDKAEAAQTRMQLAAVRAAAVIGGGLVTAFGLVMKNTMEAERVDAQL